MNETQKTEDLNNTTGYVDGEHKHPLGANVTEEGTHESPQFDHLKDDIKIFEGFDSVIWAFDRRYTHYLWFCELVHNSRHFVPLLQSDARVDVLRCIQDDEVTDGTAVESLDLSTEHERLEREQRELSRKEHGPANWERQRQRVAGCHLRIKRKRRDFLHKLTNYYAREYELVVVEDLDVKGMLESPRNSRNTASAGWNTFTDMLETKCEREGTHFVEVDPEDTTKECASCGVKTDKPLWVREHSCPACGLEADRDANAAWNILSRGLTDLGVGHSEGTPVETARPTGTAVVPAKRVLEAGSPCLKEAVADG